MTEKAVPSGLAISRTRYACYVYFLGGAWFSEESYAGLETRTGHVLRCHCGYGA
jgi:hypothetical protein